MFRDAFGLGVSEGALMNMFIRSHARFKIEAEKAKRSFAQRALWPATRLAFDRGNEAYHWVFHCKDAVVHQPDYSRAARVVEETMGGHSRRCGFRITRVWDGASHGCNVTRSFIDGNIKRPPWPAQFRWRP